jgi:rhodanese-related sulfurtransferase
MSRRFLVTLLSILLAFALVTSAIAQSQAPAKKDLAAAAPGKKLEVPKKKQTSLGLYVTAKEAYDMWQKNPDKIKILDCRTPEEYAFVGHAPMAYNVPSKFVKYRWNAKKKSYVMQDNPLFIRQVKNILKPEDTILIMCRSGGRSAKSVNKLAENGYKNVYNIINGFEGDKIKDKNNPNYGKRTKNGWKNSGVPWTYDLDINLMYLPYGKPKTTSKVK